jgi:hypothetical protein
MLGTLISKAATLPSLWRGASRRRERREPLQGATIAIDGADYAAENWSASGFLATPCHLDREVGDRVAISFSAPLPEGRFDFECEAILVRIDAENGEVAGAFVMMDTKTQVGIAQHFN